MTINGFAHPISILNFQQKKSKILEIYTVQNAYGANLISITFDTIDLHKSFPLVNLLLDATNKGFEIRNLG